jgi:uncharacterized protein YxjI
MRQRLFAFRDRYVIRDHAGLERYYVEGALFSWGDHLRFLDQQARELGRITQRLLAWGPTYEVHRAGVLAAVVTNNRFSLFSCRLTVDVPGPNDIEAAGDLLHHEYVFRRAASHQPIALVSKRWLTIADTYSVEIQEGEDDVLILAASVVIDLACHNHDAGLLGFSS